MGIRERAYRSVTILDIEGRLTVETVPELRLPERVRCLLQSGCTQIILNLEKVPGLDSSGISALVQAYVATTRTKSSLKLLHLTPRVREVLRVTRLLTVFEVFDTEEEALDRCDFGFTSLSLGA
jgi:anti-anti-sigma factor